MPVHTIESTQKTKQMFDTYTESNNKLS